MYMASSWRAWLKFQQHQARLGILMLIRDVKPTIYNFVIYIYIYLNSLPINVMYAEHVFANACSHIHLARYITDIKASTQE